MGTERESWEQRDRSLDRLGNRERELGTERQKHRQTWEQRESWEQRDRSIDRLGNRETETGTDWGKKRGLITEICVTSLLAGWWERVGMAIGLLPRGHGDVLTDGSHSRPGGLLRDVCLDCCFLLTAYLS